MFGGYTNTNMNIYLTISKLAIFGWILFGMCILNKNQGYPDNSFSKQIFKDMGLPCSNNGDKFTMFLIILSILNAIRKTRDCSVLYILGLYTITNGTGLKKILYNKV
jgi:hypothetical protein